jgi:hypothetical protein
MQEEFPPPLGVCTDPGFLGRISPVSKQEAKQQSTPHRTSIAIGKIEGQRDGDDAVNGESTET